MVLYSNRMLFILFFRRIAKSLLREILAANVLLHGIDALEDPVRWLVVSCQEQTFHFAFGEKFADRTQYWF